MGQRQMIVTTVEKAEDVGAGALRAHGHHCLAELDEQVLPFVVAALSRLAGAPMPATSVPEADRLPRGAEGLFELVSHSDPIS